MERTYQPALKRLFRLIYLLLLLTLIRVAAEASDLDCIKDIELPTYSFVARRSQTGGTVTAIVTVGQDGKASRVTTPDADANLAEEVRDSLSDGTSYLPSCAGKNLTIVFTFKLEGEPVDNPYTSIHFEPPNHFVIISRPKKPYILFHRDQPAK
jgi:hypothetical protein